MGQYARGSFARPDGAFRFRLVSFNWESRGSPVGIAFGVAVGGEPMGAQHCHRLVGKDTVGTTAIGDNLLMRFQLGQAVFQLLDRDRASARNMALAIFQLGAYIQDQCLAILEAAREFLAGDWLEGPAVPAVGSNPPVD